MTVFDKTYAAVLFDNDGTLIDSLPAARRAWITWAEQHGFESQALDDWHGVPALQIVQALLPDHDHEALTREITDLELADTDGVTALPGAVDAVAALAPAGACAIVTSATRDLAEVRLAAAGIPSVQQLVTFDDVENGKPAPDPFLLGAERLQVDVTDCLVVEDALNGITAAITAGCDTLALTTTHSAAELEGLASVVVANLAAVQFRVTPTGRVEVHPVEGS